MRERLASAQHDLSRAISVLGEREATSRSREASLLAVRQRVDGGEDTACLRRSLREEQQRFARAEIARQIAQQARIRAATHVAEAQADYDSTREGLHELRDALDRAEAADLALQERYQRARRTYEAEAGHREVEFGPQVPLSRQGMDDSPLGRELTRLEASGWLKSAPTPDTRTGLYSHRVNLVRRDGSARRSVTLPYLSPDPIHSEPVPGGWALPGEPTLGTVASEYGTQVEEVDRCGSYVSWRQHLDLPNSLLARQRWRASVEVAKRLNGFLRARPAV